MRARQVAEKKRTVTLTVAPRSELAARMGASLAGGRMSFPYDGVRMEAGLMRAA